METHLAQMYNYKLRFNTKVADTQLNLMTQLQAAQPTNTERIIYLN